MNPFSLQDASFIGLRGAGGEQPESSAAGNMTASGRRSDKEDAGGELTRLQSLLQDARAELDALKGALVELALLLSGRACWALELNCC